MPCFHCILRLGSQQLDLLLALGVLLNSCYPLNVGRNLSWLSKRQYLQHNTNTATKQDIDGMAVCHSKEKNFVLGEAECSKTRDCWGKKTGAFVKFYIRAQTTNRLGLLCVALVAIIVTIVWPISGLQSLHSTIQYWFQLAWTSTEGKPKKCRVKKDSWIESSPAEPSHPVGTQHKKIIATLLSGDWTWPDIKNYCQGCCFVLYYWKAQSSDLVLHTQSYMPSTLHCSTSITIMYWQRCVYALFKQKGLQQ